MQVKLLTLRSALPSGQNHRLPFIPHPPPSRAHRGAHREETRGQSQSQPGSAALGALAARLPPHQPIVRISSGSPHCQPLPSQGPHLTPGLARGFLWSLHGLSSAAARAAASGPYIVVLAFCFLEHSRVVCAQKLALLGNTCLSHPQGLASPYPPQGHTLLTACLPWILLSSHSSVEAPW